VHLTGQREGTMGWKTQEEVKGKKSQKDRRKFPNLTQYLKCFIF